MTTIQGSLGQICSEVGISSLQPISFFVAWNGVFILVYDGFTDELLTLKTTLDKLYGSVLPKENPGSKYPKTTVGALSDGQRLTYEELCDLRDICRSYQSRLSTPQFAVPITSLSLVTYSNRALIDPLCAVTFPLKKATQTNDQTGKHESSTITTTSTSAAIPSTIPQNSHNPTISLETTSTYTSPSSVSSLRLQSKVLSQRVLSDLCLETDPSLLSNPPSPKQVTNNLYLSESTNDSGDDNERVNKTVREYLVHVNPFLPTIKHNTLTDIKTSCTSITNSTNTTSVNNSNDNCMNSTEHKGDQVEILPNRASHYLSPSIGTTLVSYLNPFCPPSSTSPLSSNNNPTPSVSPSSPSPSSVSITHSHPLLQIIADFQQEIANRFPNKYTFFPLPSLHITIRGMLG